MKQPFSKLVKSFSENLDIRNNSRDVYIRVLTQFSHWVVRSGLNVKALTRADILRYKSDLMKENKSENTVDLYLTVLRSFFSYTEATGEHDNIAAGIHLKHKRKGFRKKHLSIDQVKQLYSVIDRTTIVGMRDYALINLLLKSGMRTVEASRLRVCDIEVTGGIARVSIWRKGDNDRSEQIGVTMKAVQPVLDYLSYRGVSDEDEYIFISHNRQEVHTLRARGIGDIVTRHLKAAGLYSKMITPHSLRHTTAVQALQSGAMIKDIQLLLGHRSVGTTEIYLKSVEDERRLNNPVVYALDDLF